MKKIGIITYLYYYNYGTMLQGYALQKVMEREGKGSFSSELIDCRFGEKHLSFWYYFKIRVRRFFIYFIQIKRVFEILKKSVLINTKFKNENAQKRQLFDNFVKQCCSMSEVTYKQSSDLYLAPPIYDIYVTGSDQTWSPKVGLRDSLFLGFAPKNKVKAAYAPSIGVASYSLEEEQYVREHLKGYQFVSCREKHGADILGTLSPVPVETVVDPTLLLRADEWRQVAIIPDGLPEKYILCYFIGERMYYREFAKQLSKQMNLPLVYIPGSHIDIKDENHIVWKSGHREFLGLIDHAEVVLTDSFHGTIFSINFKRNFYSFIKHEGAKAMDNMRIIDILGRLGQSDRLLTEYDGKHIDYKPVDYTSTDSLLHAERDSSESFVNKILASVQ